MPENPYKPYQLLISPFKGLFARESLDRVPSGGFLNLSGCLEREEHAISTRYGSVLINRDAHLAGTSNYFFTRAPVVLARLRALGGNTYRYAVLADGSLWRRAGDTQGAYSQIIAPSGLSGKPFTALTMNVFAGGNPWLFLFDSSNPVKDNGSGIPSRIGIFPPTMPAASEPYVPSNGNQHPTYFTVADYDTSFSLSSVSTGGTIALSENVASGTAGPGGYYRYQTAATGTATATISTITPTDLIAIPTGPPPPPPPGGYPPGFIWPPYYYVYSTLTVVTTTANGLAAGQNTTIAGNSVATYNGTFSVLALVDSTTFKVLQSNNTSAPIGTGGTETPGTLNLIYDGFRAKNLSSARGIQILSRSGYVYWVDDTGLYSASDTLTATSQTYTIAASTTGTLSLSLVSGSPAVSSLQLGGSSGALFVVVLDASKSLSNIASIQLQFDTNNSGYVSYYTSTLALSSSPVNRVSIGSFTGVGLTGNQWTNVTGVRLVVNTNSSGSASVNFNSIYILPNAGPSSQGGVGYDYRYVYKNANTLTLSNGSPVQVFLSTLTNSAGSSNLYVFNTPVNVLVQYSSDPQVTHIEIYRRGGLYGTNWFYLDQIPNLTGLGTVSYVDLLPDSTLQQSNPLVLTNDVPVSSSLAYPIAASLSTALPTPAPPSGGFLVTVNVNAQGSPPIPFTFVNNQVVNIGSPSNLEQTYVVIGGSGQFTAWVQLAHGAGESVTAYSAPGQPCNLAAFAYNLLWLAGDPNNPSYLYYSNAGHPENFSPAQYIPVSSPSDPITLVINWRGTLFVSTLSQWWQIWPPSGGNPPYAQPVGSAHGCVASLGYAFAEGEVWNPSADGLRAFNSVANAYKSLPIEWLWQNNPLTPVPLIDTANLSNFLGAYQNNTATFVYPGIDGNQHCLYFHSLYQRYRNSDIPITAMLLETDTNTLVYAKYLPGQGYAICYDSYSQDYDDGGYAGGSLVTTPIPFTMQTPFTDQGAPNNEKQYQALTLDVNPNGQTLSVTLLFDDGGAIFPVNPTPATITGYVRAKFEFQINAGLGQQAYRISLQISGSVTAAPIIYQAEVYAAILADQRTSHDTYQMKVAGGESGIVKQCFCDYTSTASISVNLYADGSSTPYFSFTLAANPNRSEVPVRVRFPALLMRLFRMVSTSTQPFQYWSPITIEAKPARGGAKGYSKIPLDSTVP